MVTLAIKLAGDIKAKVITEGSLDELIAKFRTSCASSDLGSLILKWRGSRRVENRGGLDLSYLVVWGIAFRLNCPNPFIFVFEHKVNTAIPTPLPRIVVPQPDFIYLGCPLRIVLQKPLYEMLKLSPPLSGIRIKGRQEVCKGRHLFGSIPQTKCLELFRCSGWSIGFPRRTALSA